MTDEVTTPEVEVEMPVEETPTENTDAGETTTPEEVAK